MLSFKLVPHDIILNNIRKYKYFVRQIIFVSTIYQETENRLPDEENFRASKKLSQKSQVAEVPAKLPITTATPTSISIMPRIYISKEDTRKVLFCFIQLA